MVPLCEIISEIICYLLGIVERFANPAQRIAGCLLRFVCSLGMLIAIESISNAVRELRRLVVVWPLAALSFRPLVDHLALAGEALGSRGLSGAGGLEGHCPISQ